MCIAAGIGPCEDGGGGVGGGRACGFQKERNWSGKYRVLVILCESPEQTVPSVTQSYTFPFP